MAKIVWTMDEALSLVRALQQSCRQFGYHLAMGGGVLNKGTSEKDLDLYFLPLNNPKYKEDASGLVKSLSALWGDPDEIGASYEEAAPPENPVPPGPVLRGGGGGGGGAVQGIGGLVNDAMQGLAQRGQINRPSVIAYNNDLARARISDWFEVNNPFGPPVKKTPTPKDGAVYKYRLKFVRKTSKDRIDVFIL